MFSHLELMACKAPNSCPTLAGNTFKIKLDSSVQGVDGATVEIKSDLSYTIKTPGHPDQTGQLTPDGPNRFKYAEAGPPPVSGRLTCLLDKWYFNDRVGGGGAGESGVLELVEGS